MLALSEPVSSLVLPAFVAALVAAAVTLLIEVAAKPRLEARKERILDLHRRRRDVIRRIVLIQRHVTRLRDDIELTQIRDMFDEELPGLRAEVRELEDVLAMRPRLLARVVHTGLAFELGRLAAIIEFSQRFSLGETEEHRTGMVDALTRYLTTPFEELADYLTTPRWRMVKRYRFWLSAYRADRERKRKDMPPLPDVSSLKRRDPTA